MEKQEAQHFVLDVKNLSTNFAQIRGGIGEVKELMDILVKIYPELRQSPDFIRFKDEPNLVARACMLTPETPAEIFFVAIREKDDKGEHHKMYFSKKYCKKIKRYRKNS